MKANAWISLSAIALVLGAARGQTTAAYIGQLVKPGTGNDSKARLEIRRVTNYGFRPGAESERSAQETDLLAGLAKASDWEVKAYLMDEIRYGGKSASIVPLSGYLNDPNLCEPAAMALLSIGVTEGSGAILPLIRTALIASTGKCAATLMRAAGSIRDNDPATVDFLIGMAANADRGVHYVALRGLADIGDPKARGILAAALKATDAFDRSQAVDLNLLFAMRLAERGSKADANAIAQDIRASGAAGGLRNVVVHADSTLEAIKNAVVSVNRAESKYGTVRTDAMRTDIRVDSGIHGGSIRVTATGGPYRVRISDLRGRRVLGFQGDGSGAREYSLGSLPMGIYRMSWEDAAGRQSRNLLLP